MEKLIFLSGIAFIIILCGFAIQPGYSQFYHDFPPTSAFRDIGTQNGTIHAKNYYYPLNVTGSGNISVTGSNKTHTMIISANSNFGSGTYNTTQANNVNKNTGGYKLNFINGTGCTVNVLNSKSSTQVNVTIACTGSGGTITGSGSANQMTYWTSGSAIAGTTNLIWDNANNVLKGLSDVTTSLGTSSLRFLNVFGSVINGTTVRANTFTASTGSLINITNSDMKINLNKIIATDFNLYEKQNTYGASGFLTQGQMANIGNQFSIAPNGTSTNSFVSIFRTSNVVNNIQELRLGSDQHVTNELAIDSVNSGNAAKVPINMYVNGTKIISLDTTSSETFYKPLIGSGAGIQPQTSTGSAVFGGFDISSGATFTIASSATATPFSNSNNFQGLIIGRDDTQNTSCLLWIGNGGSIIITQTSVDCQATSTPSASQTGYYNNGGIFTIKNGFAVTHTYKILALVRTGSNGS